MKSEQQRIRLRVRELAEARNLNMNKLAIQAGLSIPVVRRYWYNSSNGKNGGPPLAEISLRVLAQMADVLGVEPGDLLERVQ